ncbi:GNAT family N-acetyltransferase [Streptomyces sp. NPDC096136]|uniref:GNAT family N-acetyltransferase n=1 Tax=Streptomyces sp. NPDC096136 TaxID=3366076 RepID=UPI0038030279
MELPRGLPRQSPGSDTSTRHLLSLCGPLPERPRVLDIGCGPGRSALLLAAEAGGAGRAEVTAVDPHAPFLEELRAAAASRGLGGRVRAVRADRGALPFQDGSFDLVWAEGCACSPGRPREVPPGFDRALSEWKRLLAPGGRLVLSTCEWTAGEPSAGGRAFREPRYPLRSSARDTAAVQAAGYRLLGSLLQPDSDRAGSDGPLGRRGWVLAPVSAGDPAAGGGRWRTRPEKAADAAAVRAVNLSAFETPLEADLVDALRADGSWLPGLSYVAEGPDGKVAAHALLTRCTVDGAPALALAPVAADPALQRSGAGSAVVRALLAAAAGRGEALVLVLGHPSYYARFGFLPASRYGITAPFEVPDEAMMALVLDGSAAVPSGTIGYPAPFGI